MSGEVVYFEPGRAVQPVPGGAVAEVDHAVTETAFIEELELKRGPPHPFDPCHKPNLRRTGRV